MQNKTIRVKGLKKSYRQLEVLKGVDFEVIQGTVFALLGSNGAGKTTIVKILTTLLKQDSGIITVNGFDIATKPGNVRQSISLTVVDCCGRNTHALYTMLNLGCGDCRTVSQIGGWCKRLFLSINLPAFY